MNKTNCKNILIVSVAAVVVMTASALFATKVYANTDCEQNYGGGETCLINKRFKIEKWVRLEGQKTDKACEEWADEVTVDLTDKNEKEKYIEFCVKVTNKSDKVGDMNYDNMKMKDFLPDELKRIAGDGLTEEWDNFKPGESKKFYIKVRITDHEMDKSGEYEKCAVNKASVYWGKELEGSDTATVCWKNYDKKIKELPKTGEPLTVGVLGAGLAAVGALVAKKARRKAQ